MNQPWRSMFTPYCNRCNFGAPDRCPPYQISSTPSPIYPDVLGYRTPDIHPFDCDDSDTSIIVRLGESIDGEAPPAMSIVECSSLCDQCGSCEGFSLTPRPDAGSYQCVLRSSICRYRPGRQRRSDLVATSGHLVDKSRAVFYERQPGVSRTVPEDDPNEDLPFRPSLLVGNGFFLQGASTGLYLRDNSQAVAHSLDMVTDTGRRARWDIQHLGEGFVNFNGTNGNVLQIRRMVATIGIPETQAASSIASSIATPAVAVCTLLPATRLLIAVMCKRSPRSRPPINGQYVPAFRSLNFCRQAQPHEPTCYPPEMRASPVPGTSFTGVTCNVAAISLVALAQTT